METELFFTQKKKHQTLENNFSSRLDRLEKLMGDQLGSLRSEYSKKLQSLNEQLMRERKEDIQTFTENLNYMQKVRKGQKSWVFSDNFEFKFNFFFPIQAHEQHVELQRNEIQGFHSKVDLLTAGQYNLSSRVSLIFRAKN